MSKEKQTITISTSEVLKRLKKDDKISISEIVNKMLVEVLPCTNK